MKGTKVALGILLVKNSCGYTVCLMHTYTYYMHKANLIDDLGHTACHITCYLAKNSHGVVATLEDCFMNQCITPYLLSVST